MWPRRMHFAVILEFNEGSQQKTPKGTSDPRRTYQTPTSNFLSMAPTVDIQSISGTSTASVGFPVAILEEDLRPVAVRLMWARCGS